MKWEYKAARFRMFGFWSGNFDSAGLRERLNDLGQQGWELVSAVRYGKELVAILKRSI